MKKFVLLVLIVFSCNHKEIGRNGIFFGAHIINPSSTFVSLYKNSKIIDTFNLNKNYRFEKKYDTIIDGIYELEHIPERQSILIENGDSIWVRINSSAFDESIFFSGRGSSKNNFLIQTSLNQNNENDFLSTMYSKNGLEFNLIIDSLMNDQKESWIRMDSLNRLSKIAQKITQASYIYSYATKRERYALLRGTYWNEKQDSLFFDYRKYLNYGDNDLAFFTPYINYILNYVNEKALDSGQLYFNQKDLTSFNVKRLNVIDNLISGNLLRNNLTKAIALEEILNFENKNDHDLFLKVYSTINTSNKYLSEILEIHSDIANMTINKRLPRIDLQGTDGESTNSSILFNRKSTVLYFWSQTQMNHFRNSLNRVAELKKEYPKIRFIGICIQPFNPMISEVLKMMKINLNDQYSLVDFENASKKWVLTYLNKAIIIDHNGKINQGFGNFLDQNFEDYLKKN